LVFQVVQVFVGLHELQRRRLGVLLVALLMVLLLLMLVMLVLLLLLLFGVRV